MKYQDLLKDKSLTYEQSCEKYPNYTNYMNVSARSSKYIKTVIIPELRAKADYYKSNYRSVTLNNKKKSEISKKVNGVMRAELNTAKRKLFGKAQTKINQRAGELYVDKLRMSQLNSLNYLDGVLYYPIIQSWLAKNKTLTEGQFKMFVILYCHKWMLTKEAKYFGFTTNMSTRLMSQLSEKEFAQTVTVQRKKAYSTTLKGNSYMRSFMIFSRNKVKTMWEELDKKEPDDREGNNWLVYNGKYLHRLNIYEETDFNKFDKGAV